MPDRKLIFVQLNELNFQYLDYYMGRLPLKNFEKLFELGVLRTTSEDQYDLLEPWIQWVSIFTGLDAKEHGIRHLGDVVGSSNTQIFEAVEARGLNVGAVCPMNVENRLSNASYFVPDPWTRTPTDGRFWSRALTRAISQAVNDNSSGRLTTTSAIVLACGLARFAQAKHLRKYAALALRSKGAPWRKALGLDLFLHDLHFHLFQRFKPHFSTLFLNAGAHIQHHYLFNSPAIGNRGLRNPRWYVREADDPIAEMLVVYDSILGDYLALKDASLLVATGLTQEPYDRIKFYYRLRNHGEFLRLLGIRFKSVLPRMTRDFLVEFDSETDAVAARSRLESVTVQSAGAALFGQVWNRGSSLFVTLTYPNEIDEDAIAIGGPAPLRLHEHVVFVAIKNGMHSDRGYIGGQGEIRAYFPRDLAHVKNLYSTIAGFLGIDTANHHPPTGLATDGGRRHPSGGGRVK